MKVEVRDVSVDNVIPNTMQADNSGGVGDSGRVIKTTLIVDYDDWMNFKRIALENRTSALKILRRLIRSFVNQYDVKYGITVKDQA